MTEFLVVLFLAGLIDPAGLVLDLLVGFALYRRLGYWPTLAVAAGLLLAMHTALRLMGPPPINWFFPVTTFGGVAMAAFVYKLFEFVTQRRERRAAGGSR